MFCFKNFGEKYLRFNDCNNVILEVDNNVETISCIRNLNVDENYWFISKNEFQLTDCQFPHQYCHADFKPIFSR